MFLITQVVDPVNIKLNDKDVVIDDVDDEVSSSVEHKMVGHNNLQHNRNELFISTQ